MSVKANNFSSSKVIAENLRQLLETKTAPL